MVEKLDFYQNYQIQKINNLPEYIYPSLFLKIKECPRQWSYENANLDNIDKKNFIRINNLAFIKGTIIHNIIDVYIKKFKKFKCTNYRHENFKNVEKETGGLEKLLEDQIKEYVKKIISNPRCVFDKEELFDQLKVDKQFMRERIKKQIKNWHFDFFTNNNNENQTNINKLYKLPNGVFSEEWVTSEQIKWKGKIDFLKKKDQEIEIIDYKTGAQKDRDKEQILLYALIWYLDNIKNPNSIPANKLTLIYGTVPENVEAKKNDELELFKKDIIQNTKKYRKIFEINPIKAIPTLENCKWCNVKQLCDSYWKYCDENPIDLDNNQSIDVYLNNIKKIDTGSWQGQVEHSNYFKVNSLIDINTNDNAGIQKKILDISRKVIIFNAKVFVYEDESDSKTNSISCSKYSEIFKIN